VGAAVGRISHLPVQGQLRLDTLLQNIYYVNVEFGWNAANVEHIARHGITPQEAEEAIQIEPLDADVQPHDGELRVLCFGRTKSGRLLTVLHTEQRGKLRVVTAYEMTKQQERLYFKGIRV
jgi:uncharacterized DUF497 family protein